MMFSQGNEQSWGGGQLQAKVPYLLASVRSMTGMRVRDCRYMSVWTTQENTHPGSLHLQDLTWARFCDLICSERKLQTQKIQPDSFKRKTFCLRGKKRNEKLQNS